MGLFFPSTVLCVCVMYVLPSVYVTKVKYISLFMCVEVVYFLCFIFSCWVY